MIADRVALDLPEYQSVLTGHYQKDSKYRSWRENGTDDWLLIATLAGSGRFSAGGAVLRAQPRDIVLIRPGVTHDYGTAAGSMDWELLWAHFHPRPHWYDWLVWGEDETRDGALAEEETKPHSGLMRLRPTDQTWTVVLDRLWRSHRLATDTAPHSRDLAMTALEEVVLLCHREVLRTQRPMDARVTAALQYIHAQMAESISVRLLSDHVELSPSRLSHLFQQQMGMAPMQYLDLQRIERSKVLLERTTSGVKSIAEEVGLDPVYFSLRFKQHTGLSPRQYRNRGR